MRIITFLLIAFNFSYSQIELPEYNSNDQVYRYTGFTLCYSEEHEQAKWVAYELTALKVAGSIDRTDNFYSDSRIITESASLADYKGSGYDRGHLAPAADMKWSFEAMRESFSLANMSPQLPGFNRGIWKKLEDQVRAFALSNQLIYIVTGPILEENLPKIGPNGVSIPNEYFKVILDYQEPELKGIGFILKNESSSTPLKSFIVSIDSLEQLTGLNFFPALPDSIEEILEASVNITSWGIKGNSSSTTSSIAVRCNGITLKGFQCKRNTTNENGYCWQHQNQTDGLKTPAKTNYSPSKSYASQCLGTTKAGRRCKRTTKDISGYCWQHK
jgi:endonuclease G